MNTQIDGLGTMAGDIAARAALAYMKCHDLKFDHQDLAAELRIWTKTKLPEAMADAKAALDCGLDRVAEMTFAATMAQAGIEAAKCSGIPRNIDGDAIARTFSYEEIMAAATV